MIENKLTIVATIIAKEGKHELVKTELSKLLAPTRAEEGCINYDLHQDNENPHEFLYFENWATRDLWLAHMETPHIKSYLAAVDGSIERFSVKEMTQIG